MTRNSWTYAQQTTLLTWHRIVDSRNSLVVRGGSLGHTVEFVKQAVDSMSIDKSGFSL